MSLLLMFSFLFMLGYCACFCMWHNGICLACDSMCTQPVYVCAWVCMHAWYLCKVSKSSRCRSAAALHWLFREYCRLWTKGGSLPVVDAVEIAESLNAYLMWVFTSFMLQIFIVDARSAIQTYIKHPHTHTATYTANPRESPNKQKQVRACVKC